MLRITPSNASDGPRTMYQHMFRPTIRSLQHSPQRSLVLDARPIVERLGRGVSHDQVHEVLVSPELFTIAHERQNLRSVSNANCCGKLVAITVVLLTSDEEVSRNLVGLDPDVDNAHDFPFVDGTIFLVECSKVPCCLDTRSGNVPETTRIR